MSLLDLLLIAVGLSMDAFAVSICQGLCMNRINWRSGGIIALFFGAFQAIMPLLGWFLGSHFAQRIETVDHWVAFVLLALIGGNMIREALGPEEEADACALDEKLNYRRLLVLAVATSIDALAIGVTFAFLSVKILPAVSLIGLTTFAISLAGVAVGNYFGTRYKQRAEFAGGLILILLGLKILLEHLGLW